MSFRFAVFVAASLAHPTPLPTFGVFVQSLPKVEVSDSAWAIAATMGSLLVALATGALAWFTYVLARETRDSLKVSRDALQSEQDARAAEERRHMDGFMPHIALIVQSLELTESPLTESLMEEIGLTKKDVLDHSKNTILFAKNIGSGPACEIEVRHANKGGNGIELKDPPVALAVGQEVQLLRRRDGIRDKWNIPRGIFRRVFLAIR